MDNIKGKTVLVTGGASGLGYKFSELLLRNGAKSVAILDLSSSPGQNAAGTLEKEFGKGKAIFFACDVSKADQLTECFKKVVNAFKVLDIIVNNAGIFNEKNWEQVLSVNLNALIRASLLAMDHMGKHKDGKGGLIVNIASVVGLCPLSYACVYSASKHGVVGFSRCIQNYYDKSGVRVLVLCPGHTHTAILNDLQKRVTDLADEEDVIKQMESFVGQEPDDVGRALIDLIQKGKNGAVWVSEDGEPPYAVDFPHYSKLSVPV